MTLAETLQKLDDFRDGDSIYAHRIAGEWTLASPALVADPGGPCSLMDDGRITQLIGSERWEYLLGVATARKAVSFLREWTHDPDPSIEDRLRAITYYAAHQSFLPVGDYYSQEHAEALDIGVNCDVGAPLPILVVSEHRAILSYLVALEDSRNNPGREAGSTAGSSVDRVAVVEFADCRAAMLGDPDEQTLCRHPLWGRGIHPYGAFIIRNSSWVAQLREMDVGSDHHAAQNWDEVSHYVWTFHDSTLQCVAREFKIHISEDSLSRIVDWALHRIF